MQTRITGFSLVEMMVVVGIVGILAAIAIPRYHSFLVQARRAEATSNLNHIAALQESYKAEHGSYYYGNAMAGNNGIGYKDGLGKVGNCNDPVDASDEGLSNHLGFRPKGCNELRYFYQLRGGALAVASAASDGDKDIYPDCSGRGCWKCGYDSGDALWLRMNTGKPEVCRNITQYCPDAAGGCSAPPANPPAQCTCTTTTTCGSVAPACVGQFSEKSCTKKTLCVGDPSCASSSVTTLPPVQVPGTETCNCDCPLDPDWPAPSVDPATKCSSDTPQTQTMTEIITCPDPSTATQNCTYSRSVPGTKVCCNPLIQCCNGDDIDPNQTMMGGTGQEFCCPTIKLDENYSCTGAGRKWNSSQCKCECFGGLASSCIMGNGADGSPGPFWEFIGMSVSSEENTVADNACKCVCDADKVNAAICAARTDGKTDYEATTCSCIDPPIEEDKCSDGIAVQEAGRVCEEKSGQWRFSPGIKDANTGKFACTCTEFCSNGLTEAQTKINCDGQKANNTCPGAADGYRYERCNCVEPLCERRQCVVEAVTDQLGTNDGLTSLGNDIAACYSGCTSSANKKKCFKDIIVDATQGQGDADKIRELHSLHL